MTALKSYQFEKQLPQIHPDSTAGILFYGPNDGLVDELIQNTIHHSLGKNNDHTFSLVQINNDNISQNPNTLLAEIQALSFLGGNRIVLVDSSLDSLATLIDDNLEYRTPSTLILVRASILSPRSSLRSLFEKHKNLLAVPCYNDDARTHERLLSQTLKNEQIHLSPKALAWTLAALSPDRRHAKNQIEKLILLAGHQKSLPDDHLHLILENADNLTIDTLIDTTFSGQTKKLVNLLLENRQLNDTNFNMRLVRACASHVNTLLTLFRLHSLENRTFKDALSHIQPRLFFKREPSVQKQCKLWNSAQKLHKASSLLLGAEKRIKTHSSLPASILVERVLLNLSQTSLRS